MKSNRLLELLFVLALISVGYKLMAPKEAKEPVAAAQTTPPASTSKSGPIEFSLPQVNGGDYHFEADGEKWTFVTLTATGCGGCIERQPLDAEAYEFVKGQGGRAISLYLYGNQARFESILKEHPSLADTVLADYQAKVGVAQLKGSDSQCWLLIKPDGTIAWQGAADFDSLQAALKKG